MENNKPTAMEAYLFDLRGYLVLKNAVPKNILEDMNSYLDSVPQNIKPNDWLGNVHCQNHNAKLGINLQQIYEAKPFRFMIDNPAWIEKVKHFVGGEGTFDYNHGAVFIDENFANLRGPGQAIGLHSGGHEGTKRTQFRYRNGQFHCGQVNILLALTDIGPGDGATMVIPGSHKSNLKHPHFSAKAAGDNTVDNVEGAIEVHLNAGDAILFVDAISHGSAERKNPGQRRISVFRYGPSWGNFRFGYQPSEEMLADLTAEQRRIVKPLELIPKPFHV